MAHLTTFEIYLSVYLWSFLHSPLHTQSSVHGRNVFLHLQFPVHPILQPHFISWRTARDASGRSVQYGKPFSVKPKSVKQGRRKEDLPNLPSSLLRYMSEKRHLITSSEGKEKSQSFPLYNIMNWDDAAILSRTKIYPETFSIQGLIQWYRKNKDICVHSAYHDILQSVSCYILYVKKQSCVCFFMIWWCYKRVVETCCCCIIIGAVDVPIT